MVMPYVRFAWRSFCGGAAAGEGKGDAGATVTTTGGAAR